MTQQTLTQSSVILTPEALLKHWQGHRNLTRRVIEKFPEHELFNFSIGGMRTFAQLATELLSIAGPSLQAIVANDENPYTEERFTCDTKEALLQKWDEETEVINTYYAQIPAERFSEVFNLFGQYKNEIIHSIFYFIDNENHHRGQGYVYLRALNIEPPFFWER